MICKDCKQEYDKWIPVGGIENNLCPLCNEWHWKQQAFEHSTEINEIKKIESKGHPHHCACRQVWGDGECECDLYKAGYDPYAWMKKKP